MFACDPADKKRSSGCDAGAMLCSAIIRALGPNWSKSRGSESSAFASESSRPKAELSTLRDLSASVRGGVSLSALGVNPFASANSIHPLSKGGEKFPISRGICKVTKSLLGQFRKARTIYHVLIWKLVITSAQVAKVAIWPFAYFVSKLRHPGKEGDISPSIGHRYFEMVDNHPTRLLCYLRSSQSPKDAIDLIDS